MKKEWKQRVSLLVFVLPALVFYTVFELIPAIGGFKYSMTDMNQLNPTLQNWVGFSNYTEALTDPNFIQSISFTLKYVVFMLVLQNVIAILLAVLIESRGRSKAWFRTIFFMPNMMSMIIGGYVWVFVLCQVLPYLGTHTVFHFLNQQWTGDPKYSFFSILLVALWGGVGYLMVIYIAGLQSVPEQLREAAVIDGAGPFQTFFHVTLPMILPSLTIGIFVTLNNSFKVFDVVYAVTKGGPGRETQVVALNIFEEAFHNSSRFGYASAKAIILALIIFVITLIQLRVMKKREVEV